MILTNLFGKYFKVAFLVIVITELFSFWSHQFILLNQILFIVILLIALLLSLKNLKYGLYLLLIELIIGSKGYLFLFLIGDIKISIRMGIFLVLIAAWIYGIFRGKYKQFFSSQNQFLYYYLGLALFIIIGLINGLAHHSFNNIFFDFNGWLYFILLPIFFSAVSSKPIIKNILSILLAAVTYLSIKTLAMLLIFVHGFGLPLTIIYKWIRDSGVGEITFVNYNFYRIFFQAHIYVLIGFFIAITLLIFSQRLNLSSIEKKWLYLITLLSSTTIIASLSRSFWIGLALALIIVCLVLLIKLRPNLVKILKFLATLLVVFILEVGFLYLITFNFSGGLIENRLAGSTLEAAGASRISQLSPLFTAIKDQPLIGSGFGQTVTYQTEDPRIKEISPDGIYTTYAFEWGYLDIWLKIGLLGLLSYLLILVKVFTEGRKLMSVNLEYYVLILGLLLGFIALAVTSIFSPYLNHPLGIGYLMLVSSILFFLNYNYVTRKNKISH